MTKLNPAEQKFWSDYLAASVTPGEAAARIDALAKANVRAGIPGDLSIADELLNLYLQGKKTAGSSLVRDFEVAGDPLPRVGDHWILLDSRGAPRCIAKVVRVEFHRFDEITLEIARAEGEGDLSLEYWRSAHQTFFAPYLPTLGISDLESAEIVTEFFEVVHR